MYLSYVEGIMFRLIVVMFVVIWLVPCKAYTSIAYIDVHVVNYYFIHLTDFHVGYESNQGLDRLAYVPNYIRGFNPEPAPTIEPLVITCPSDTLIPINCPAHPDSLALYPLVLGGCMAQPFVNYTDEFLLGTIRRTWIASDTCENSDTCVQYIGQGPPGLCGVCGDANGDGDLNVGDVVFLISYIFKGGPAPDPECRGDANGDGGTNVGDAVYLIAYVFKGGPPPVEGCCP